MQAVQQQPTSSHPQAPSLGRSRKGQGSIAPRPPCGGEGGGVGSSPPPSSTVGSAAAAAAAAAAASAFACPF